MSLDLFAGDEAAGFGSPIQIRPGRGSSGSTGGDIFFLGRSDNTAPTLRFYGSGVSPWFFGIKPSPAMSSNVTFYWPAVKGTAGDVLVSDGGTPAQLQLVDPTTVGSSYDIVASVGGVYNLRENGGTVSPSWDQPFEFTNTNNILPFTAASRTLTTTSSTSFSVILNGIACSITSTGDDNFMASSDQCYILSGSKHSQILSSFNCDIDCNGSLSGIINSHTSTLINGTKNRCAIIASDNGTINQFSTNTNNVIIGGNAHTISSGNRNSLMAGLSNSITTGSNHCMIAGNGNLISSGERNVMIGGLNNTISSGSDGVILGGSSNSVTSGSNSVVCGSSVVHDAGDTSILAGGDFYSVNTYTINNGDFITNRSMRAGAFVTISDARMKTVTGDLPAIDLNDYQAIQFKEFYYNGNIDKTPQYGVIAQEAKVLFPWLVTVDADGTEYKLMTIYTKSYITLIGAALQSEISERIALDGSVASLQTTVADLQATVAALQVTVDALSIL